MTHFSLTSLTTFFLQFSYLSLQFSIPSSSFPSILFQAHIAILTEPQPPHYFSPLDEAERRKVRQLLMLEIMRSTKGTKIGRIIGIADQFEIRREDSRMISNVSG